MPFDVVYRTPTKSLGKIVGLRSDGIFAAQSDARTHASYQAPWLPEDVEILQVLDTASSKLLWWRDPAVSSPTFYPS